MYFSLTPGCLPMVITEWFPHNALWTYIQLLPNLYILVTLLLSLINRFLGIFVRKIVDLFHIPHIKKLLLPKLPTKWHIHFKIN